MATTVEHADLEALAQALAENKLPDAEIVRRIRERAGRVIDEIGRHGETNLAVPLIREAREE